VTDHRTGLLLFLLLGLASAAFSQESATLREAQQAYEDLDFETAITRARQALDVERLTRDDRIVAYELLGFAYGALDSARLAVESFRELIFLDPDREPDVNAVSPRITALYASALGQVLVVRRLQVNTRSFVANQGSVDISFQLSRPARAIARVVGPDYDVVIDSQLVAGTGRFEWGAVTPEGDPVTPGTYQIIVTGVEAGNQYAAPMDVEVSHAAVDTLDHLTSLPGYTELPEMERPPRDWKPLGISVLYAGLSAGATVALEHSDLGESKREVLGVATLAVLTGFIMSVKKPDPEPVPANIRYNELLRQNLADRSTQIATENAERRRQTFITVSPLPGGER
jgi:hypothetical protein